MHRSLRSFSTSRAAGMDLSKLYSKLTSWRRKTSSSPVTDPTAVPEVKRTNTDLGVYRKLQVVGQPKPTTGNWEEVKEFAEFDAWPTNHYRRDLTAQDIDSAIEGVTDGEIADIQTRLNVIKNVSSKLRVAVPDPVLSGLDSVQKLREHLLDHARPFDERQPDAVYLNKEDFVGLNITIEDPVAERKLAKQKLREMVKQAKKKQEDHFQGILKSSQ